MIAAAWLIFKGSRVLQVITLALACWGIWESNNAIQWSGGKREGRAEVTNQVKEKSDADANLSEGVRVDVAAGKRGRPDPNRVRDVPAPGKGRSGI